MAQTLLPGNTINKTTGLYVFPQVTGRYTNIIAVADVNTVLQTVLPLKMRSAQPGRADIVIPQIPIGARICHLGLRVPPGLIGTNGDSIKLGNAVSNNGTQTFNATGSTAYVRSAVAANATYTPNIAANAQGLPYVFSIAPFDQAAAAGQSAALSGALTYQIFVDNGTTGAGTGVAVPASIGNAQIIAEIIYWEPLGVPRIDEIAGRPAIA